ncbi:SURF1 family protein [Mycobacterium sp. CBMA293]|uniref:SURF1 family cytochrome oxidase biogenesis protein n=2 Tax=Mycolicibacterium TaxID=1866885 RepID=UPI0012DEBA33|nr:MULTISPECIES: SURF1 family protein [unclassified Mycolicibacterium]MUL45579.1 SURF1 family protein [Mycolicibacterium sp. CBMA 360]MUL60249.1 SURF1 family protein [Mycolicibacterium sp. CBMA 335]MUL71539.1 SURF1 family protein [Mycolicibacterium sp. CBMA 311]MUL73036.1 SURF1 family protein [Mycolicibacterium sp. CBMA 311]MUL95989.1 SURF1 family protein [Mycolicibacterium sp. CBMA 230]
MRRLTFLLRPQWLALFVVVLAFVYLCFTVLAPWQLGKNTRTSRENNQIASSLKTDPVPLTSVLPHQDSSAPDAQWRRLTATGHYRPEGEVLVRLRVDDGDASYEVLTPFAVDGGPIVLVNRGYLKAGNGVPPFAAPPPGTVTITGRLRDAEPIMSGKQPFKQDRIQQVYSINTTQISQVTGVPLAGDYLQLVDGQPGGLGVIALPHLDAGPFLSYGIQWIAFGIVAPIGLGYFVFAEIRQRRLEKAQSDSRAAAAAGPDPEEPAAPLTAEEKLADRYGRRR